MIHESYRNAVRKNLFLAHLLEHLITRLAEADVTALPFKGPALAVGLYGDPCMRSFGDLDILVRPEDLGRAEEVLQKEGLAPKVPIPRRWKNTFVRNWYHYGLVHKDHEILVELHWGLVDGCHGFGLDIGFLWENLQECRLLRKTVPIPRSENLLFAMMMHGGHHLWERLLWLVDAHTFIIRNPGLDWDCIVDLTRRFRCRRLVVASLYLLHDLLETPFPSLAAKDLEADLKSLAMFRGMKEKLLMGRLQDYPKSERFLFLLKEKGTMGEKIKMAFLALTRPGEEDIAAFPLPPALGFLYGVLRPFRLLNNLIRGHFIAS